MTTLHLLNCIVELLLELLSLDSSLTFLLVLLVDKFLLKGLPFMHLLVQPSLLLHDEFLLALLEVLLMLDLFLPGKFFAQGVRLCIFALLDETLKDLFVLEELSRLLEAERLVKAALKVFSKLKQLCHVSLL